MKIARVFRKAIATDQDGVQVRGEVNAAVAVNMNEPGRTVTIVRSGSRSVARTPPTKEAKDG